MVQHGDFTIELVEAHSKIPFKEHMHDGKTYVEVEPDAEYFISIAKPGAVEFRQIATLRVEIHVDGKFLGSYSTYKTTSKYCNPVFQGTWTYENGTSSHTALKFVVPTIRAGGMSLAELAAVGKVEVKLFQALNPTPGIRNAATSTPSVALKATVAAGFDKGKKIVRSSEGSLTTEKQKTDAACIQYQKGDLLSTITLYYCTTPGLIQMGVFSGFGPPSKDKKEEVKAKK